jgi:hypothetical protein
VSTARTAAPTEAQEAELPDPFSPEGETWLYTPKQAARWLPWSGRGLRERAYRNEVIHTRSPNRRVWFTGADIRDELASYKQHKPAA